MNNKKGQIVLTVFFIIFCALVIFPFWLLLSASFSSAESITANGYQLWPKPFDLTAYKFVFSNPTQIIRAYGLTFSYSIVAMFLSVLLMAMIAYPLARSGLRGKKAINFFLYFTMLFNGGLVPTYILLAKVLHLNDTFWIYVLRGLISPWYVFMIRTFFKGIPEEIIESATIDGASEYRIFATMILPLSKPVLATVALFTFLGKWNDWQTSLIYITKPELYSLQYLLQKIMEDIKIIRENQNLGMDLMQDIPTETVRMAFAVVVAGPALVVFPFFQKYFVKGLTVGSVKG